MTSFSYFHFVNTSYNDINYYAYELYDYILQILNLFVFWKECSTEHYLSLYQSLIVFNEFQINILKSLLIVFLCINLLIFIYWKIYGHQICERFMRPATSRAIEELKASVAKLKLPKVHSPRI